ncbi:hemolysin family protein [Heyndrickxia acidiproducens]|uniref:hemolysin family protein n=1 Tax=Heyndrickxia acidiproducens TaxID=1121084 RepID=UPI00036314E3|nr:hemolysin family protein [Heyndrickxia acidiproducens]
MLTIKLILIILLIGATSFFVASEFSIVRVRTSRIDQLIADGIKNAPAAKRVITNMDSYLSTTQLGITVISLILGWLGEPTLRVIFNPLLVKIHVPETLVQVVTFILSFLIITFFSVVVGELAPKNIAIQKAEDIILVVAKPLILLNKIMFPLTWALNHASRFVTKMLGYDVTSEHEVAHSEEELRIILSESLKSGEINQSEYKYVNNIFEFDNRIAKEIMVPRTEVVTVDKSDRIEGVLKLAQMEKYTRYPVTDGDKDNIIGVLNMKEVLTDYVAAPHIGKDAPLDPYINPIIHVIETVPIQGILARMQKDNTHMAVLLDEYGGTAGIITVEDILEEIVGEIRDEFDTDEIPLIQKVGDNHYILDAKVLIEDVNDLLKIEISDEEVDTVGGWLLTQKYDLKKGDIIPFQSCEFKVINMEGSHVLYVEVWKKQEAAPKP